MNENRLSGTATVLIRRAAEDLISEVNGVRAVVVATADGFDVTSAVRGHQEPSRIAAMASSIAAISLVVSQEARLGRHRSRLGGQPLAVGVDRRLVPLPVDR